MGASDANELLLQSWSDTDVAYDKQDGKYVTIGVIPMNGVIIQ